jgi:hypothetical protein
MMRVSPSGTMRAATRSHCRNIFVAVPSSWPFGSDANFPRTPSFAIIRYIRSVLRVILEKIPKSFTAGTPQLSFTMLPGSWDIRFDPDQTKG